MSAQEKCIFVGEFRHNLDDKNRVTVPSKWRFSGDDEDVFLALPNPIGCISIYPPKMVAKLKEKVESVSLGNKKGQKALAKLFSKADYFGCDKSGRITLNEKLISHAGLTKESNLVGNFATFNIWNPERYAQYLDSNDEDPDDEISKILTELGV
jgi:MraZ protein